MEEELSNSNRKLLSPILDMCPKDQDVLTVEGIKSDVEFLLLNALKLYHSGKFKECVDTTEAVIDVTWEELNTGHWSLVPECQRRVYAVSSLLKMVALVQQALDSAHDCSVSCLEKAVKTADLGLLLGNSYRDQLTLAAHLLSEAVNKYKPEIQANSSAVSNTDAAPELRVPADLVRELHCPSLETFSTQHFYPRIPVKITGCMNHWPALLKWTDMNYLVATAGSRTVPVELGTSYAGSDWSQQLMSLRDFVSQHVTRRSDGRAGYLAQHQLFDQVPELKRDIAVPDYCACSDAEGEKEEEVDINAWFGPCSTVSPLHYDPKHNLLCQVVGKKRVTLYAPSATDSLYPHEGMLLSNTAQVDPEAPDYKVFPAYRNTQAFLCLLSPGDMPCFIMESQSTQTQAWMTPPLRLTLSPKSTVLLLPYTALVPNQPVFP